MTQTTSIQMINEAGLPFRQHLNELLSAMNSDHSGAVAPTVTQPYMKWLDTSGSPAVWKRRNSLDTAWETISTGGGGGSTAAAIRVAVIGDSLSAQDSLLPVAWPQQLQLKIDGIGGDVQLINNSVNGLTFYRALNTAYFDAQTPVAKTITDAPTHVLINLGFNDFCNRVDGRTYAQIVTDYQAVVAALKAAMPTVPVIWAVTVPYDNNQAHTGLTNKSVYPGMFNLPSAGIHAGCYSHAMLDSAITSTNQTYITEWKTFYDANKTGFDAFFEVNYWRICRLSGVARDGLHLNQFGQALFLGYVRKGLSAAISGFPTMQGVTGGYYTPWEEPDTLFTNLLTASGAAWVDNNADQAAYRQVYDNYYSDNICPSLWYLPWRARVTVTPYFDAGGIGRNYSFFIDKAKPAETIYISVNGGAWANTNETTNERGMGQSSAAADSVASLFNTGSNTLLHKIGNCIYPPRTISKNQSNLGYSCINEGTGISLKNSSSVDYFRVKYTVGGITSGLVEVGRNATAGVPGVAFKSSTGSGDSAWDGMIYCDSGSGATNGNMTFGSGVAIFGSTVVRPAFDASVALGAASYRWSVVYSSTGSINTSDERLKKFIDIDEAEKKTAKQLKKLISKYQFTEAIEEKGENARYHFGLGAQSVAETFKKNGLDPNKYGLFCYDEWEAEEALIGEDGGVMRPAKEAGNRYGLRYDELLVFIISAM